MNQHELVQKLLQIQSDDSHQEWQRHIHNLKYCMLQYNINDFLSFLPIQETMFVGNAEYTLEEFKYISRYIDLDEIEDCDLFSQHHQHQLYQTTGNTIHHRYQLLRLEQIIGRKICNFNNILELGGGYGNMCRLIYRMGFNKQYFIKDLPEFALLQQYYLEHHNISPNYNIDFTKHYDLFIATWSLSEIPLQNRSQYEHLHIDNILIAYGPNYDNIDNSKYFKYFQTKYPQHKFTHFEAPYQKNQYYLIGQKR